MKKTVKCTVLCLIMVCCVVFSLPLTAFASESYQMQINEPAKGDNQGYINLLVESTSGNLSVICISWTLLPVFTDSHVTYTATEMMISIDSDNSVTFLGRSNGNYQLSAGFSRSMSGSNNRTLYWSDYENNVALEYKYTFSGYKIVGFQIYGNGILETHDLGYNNNIGFSVTWGDDSKAVSLMTEMLAQLYISAENDETIISQLNQLLGYAQTAEELLIDINYYINSCSDKLWVIKLRVEDIQDLLEEIVEAQGESTFEEPSTESISDYNKAEDELVSGADDTADIEQQIEDFEIDANASGKIWDIITQFFNCHPKIMGLVIGILCLGIIALILNR